MHFYDTCRDTTRFINTYQQEGQDDYHGQFLTSTSPTSTSGQPANVIEDKMLRACARSMRTIRVPNHAANDVIIVIESILICVLQPEIK